MADLTDIQAAQSVKIVGVDLAGVETYPVKSTPSGQLYTYSENSLSDGSQLDAFHRLRTSNPQTIFDCTFLYDKQPLLFCESTTSGGAATYNANKASIDLSVTTTTNSETIFRSRRYIKYHPGKSQIVMVTGSFESADTNVRKRIGYFDDANGLFFELNGSTMSVVRRTSTSGSVVDNLTAQASWNVDPMDGSGPSGITLDVTKQQIFVIDFQWLGSGRIRYGFFINGDIKYVHYDNTANIGTVPWAQTAVLPVRIEIKNLGSTASNMHLTCTSVISENFWGPQGILRTVGNGTTLRSFSGTTTIPVVSLRKQSAYYKVPVQIIDTGFYTSTLDDFRVEIIINGTLTGESWANVPGVCQQDVSATAISGGTPIYQYYTSSNGSPINTSTFLAEALNTFLGSDLTTASDIISVVASNVTSSASGAGYINYKELL